MKWFRHFSNAHDSKDLTKVRLKYGAEGYAIYWYCLEVIAGDLGSDENITFELKHDAEVVGLNLKIDQVRVEEIMGYMVQIGLFERSNNTITCLKLAKYLDKKNTRNNEIHKIIDAANELNHVPDSPRLSEIVPACPPLDIELEENNNNMVKFDQVWLLNRNKVKKEYSKQKFSKLSNSDQEQLLAYLGSSHYQSIQKQFVPHLSTIINQQVFKDEIDLSKDDDFAY